MPVKRLGAVTGEVYYRSLGFEGFSGPQGAVVGPRGYLSRLAARANVALPPLDEVDAGPPLPAFLYRDRWLVACPDCRRDQQFAWERPALYMCPSCWNAAAGGVWRPVAFPAEREAIEVAVGPRRDPRTRNWIPGERVEDLLAEGVEPSKRRALTRPSELYERLQPGRPGLPAERG